MARAIFFGIIAEISHVKTVLVPIGPAHKSHQHFRFVRFKIFIRHNNARHFQINKFFISVKISNEISKRQNIKKELI